MNQKHTNSNFVFRRRKQHIINKYYGQFFFKMIITTGGLSKTNIATKIPNSTQTKLPYLALVPENTINKNITKKND